ncbi:MAG: transcription-repair coupling factor [Alphaproteobacteria bacterium RIFCSPLOWO2_12_FULL_40_11]|nr:MAG: transcription-repair coupling factor [Alphaproteobacteria bacterium RIFCSPHIGHO2_01_FULL_40_8]OFX12298.1 MAG: transcription-repair coupling factor [Alphaproteobacteria bacterium RIFCSPLOWO2_12_FULL_40_11]
MQKTISPSQIKNSGLFLQTGSKISPTQISEILISKGYTREAVANNASEFAIRGGIVDIVMQKAADLIGYRLDFFGDEIESIKIFDPITQITQEMVKSLEILPASEVILNQKTVENFRKNYREKFGLSIDDQLYNAISEGRSCSGMEHFLPLFYEEDLVSFFSYLRKPIVFFDEKIFDFAKHRKQLTNEYYQARINDLTYKPIAAESLYFSAEEFQTNLEKHTIIEFKQFDCADKNQRIIDLEIKPIPDFSLAGRTNKRDPFELMKEFTNPLLPLTTSLAFLTESSKDRIQKLLPDYGIKCSSIVLPLHFGFYTSDFFLIGEQAIFGEKVIRKKIAKAASARILEEGLSISQGELVVHRDYGIGRFEGIVLVNAVGIKTDMIKIAYGGNDTLFVPVYDIDLITRYGADNPLIQLDRLGVASWKNRCEKVRKKIKIAAEELLKIAAARKLKKAPAFVCDQHFYDEFCARFGFVETDDQLQAIAEVEEDLRKGSPMDRLICGDVGFGKTEVAMRAGAIVVSGKWSVVSQVAIITPTTLLSRQHYKNFTKRFEGTRIKIVQLSRLVSSAESKKAREQIESGEAQIVIGTHALLQKNIKFKNLALAIIDEEQHFGVAQKERLKELRNEVHILTLSATPIPRTLQMSLTGVKDLSLISTPPLDRLSIRNFFMPYDSVIVREAVMREYNRSGRVFFVVPRVRDIEEMEARLKILLPEIKITHAHGQMSPSNLDQIMNDFVDGKIDMLLSTTIIESGIDISDANTMIIYKAEMFGLAQLYQLRGRVGRSKVRGYCYLMSDNRKKISDEARKKLEVMQNLDSLGIGFTIASHDMDIRGSGNLLGDEQSGHIKETGVELYQQMLLETIQEMKTTTNHLPLTTDHSITIKLGLSLLIPEEYMPDLSLRMSFYKKIANVKNDEEAEILHNEMNDRFGKIPTEILNLFEIAKLKHRCKKLGIERLESIMEGILIGFKNNQFANPEKLLAMIFASGNKVKIHAGQRVLFAEDGDKVSSAFAAIKKLEELL